MFLVKELYVCLFGSSDSTEATKEYTRIWLYYFRDREKNMRRLEAFSHNSKRTMLIQYIYLIAADSFGGLFFIRERSSIENDLMTRGMHFPKQKNCYHLSQSHREMRRNRALDFSSLNGVFSRDHSVDT